MELCITIRKENMTKEKTIGHNQNPIQTTINKTKRSVGNMFGFDEGVDDEYFIDEIIGIEELPYKEFNKEEKKEPEEIPYLGLEDREYYEEQLQGIFPKESIRKMSDDNLLEFVKNYTTSEGGSQ